METKTQKQIRFLLGIERSIPTSQKDNGEILTIWTDTQTGQIHRDFGPAIERTDGLQIWYQQGLIHREDGPAVIGCRVTSTPDGYYLHGLQFENKEEFEQWKIEREFSLSKGEGNLVVKRFGGTCYLNAHGHREDGYAVENANGFQNVSDLGSSNAIIRMRRHFINGESLTEDEFVEWKRINQNVACNDH